MENHCFCVFAFLTKHKNPGNQTRDFFQNEKNAVQKHKNHDFHILHTPPEKVRKTAKIAKNTIFEQNENYEKNNSK